MSEARRLGTVLTLAFLTIMAGWLGTWEREDKKGLRLQVGAIVRAQSQGIPIVLPNDPAAKVTMHNDAGWQGQVSDLSTTELTIERNGDKEVLAIADVERVVFDPRAGFYSFAGELVIRGYDNALGKQDVWTIALTSFRMIDAEKGLAEIDSDEPAFMAKLAGIRAVAGTLENPGGGTFVVNELVFVEEGLMEIYTTPHKSQ